VTPYVKREKFGQQTRSEEAYYNEEDTEAEGERKVKEHEGGARKIPLGIVTAFGL